MMRRTERTLGYETCPKSAVDRVNLRRFNRLIKAHIGENGRKTLGEHRLTRAGRAYHNDVVTACGCDFQRALRLELTAHVGKIHLTDMRGEVEP